MYLCHSFSEGIVEINILVQQKLHFGLHGFISIPLNYKNLVVDLGLLMVLILDSKYVHLLLFELIVVFLRRIILNLIL